MWGLTEGLVAWGGAFRGAVVVREAVVVAWGGAFREAVVVQTF